MFTTTVKAQALATGIALALSGVCAAAGPADRIPGKAGKSAEMEKNLKKPAAPAESAKPKAPTGTKKRAGGKRSGVPDDSI